MQGYSSKLSTISFYVFLFYFTPSFKLDVKAACLSGATTNDRLLQPSNTISYFHGNGGIEKLEWVVEKGRTHNYAKSKINEGFTD